MKILVIGCNGFLGGNISDFFHQKGYVIYGCDVADQSLHNIKYLKTDLKNSELDNFLKSNSIDVCINAAGSGNVGYSILNPVEDFNSNTSAVIRILNSLRIYNPDCKYLHISSAAVYGNPKRLPIKESDELSPLSPYGYHKLMSEQLCKEYYHLYNLPITIIRPFSVYGNGLKKQLLWDICTKLKNSDTIKLHGTGNESRDFIHITEITNQINVIINKSPFKCNIYNSATGKETTIKHIATIFESHFNNKKKIFFSGEIREGDPINWRANITSSLALGFAPIDNMETEIINYIKWHTNFNE